LALLSGIKGTLLYVHHARRRFLDAAARRAARGDGFLTPQRAE
jgi:hypothetical protein